MSYGGAGPFHAAGYAAALGVETIVVPGEAASVWSAFGISQADIRYQYEASVVLIEPFDPGRVAAAFTELDAPGARGALRARGRDAFEFRRYARMRFQWQRHELEMRFPDGDIDEAAGGGQRPVRRALHRTLRRGGAAARGARGDRLDPARAGDRRWARATSTGSRSLSGEEFAQGPREVYFERGAGAVEAAVYNGDAMPLGEVVEGPAVIDLRDHRDRRPARHPVRAPRRPATSS